MNAIEFIEKLKNFDGNFDELNELYYDYIENSDDPIEYKTMVVIENSALIDELMTKTSEQRIKELPFDYYNLYNFQYKFLPFLYCMAHEEIKNKPLYDLYLDYCSSHKIEPEFDSKCFNQRIEDNGICDILVYEFLIPEAAIQPLMREIHLPYVKIGMSEDIFLPFTVEYGGKEKMWLCVHSFSLINGLKRTNLNINVYGKDEKFIQETIVDIILDTVTTKSGEQNIA